MARPLASSGVTGPVELRFELSSRAEGLYTQPAPLKLRVQKKMLGSELRFEDYGVGGLDSELQTIIRRAFMSRLMPTSLVAALGVSLQC